MRDALPKTFIHKAPREYATIGKLIAPVNITVVMRTLQLDILDNNNNNDTIIIIIEYFAKYSVKK